MERCDMCGAESKRLQVRAYAYANGERVFVPVCPNCQEWHDRTATPNPWKVTA